LITVRSFLEEEEPRPGSCLSEKEDEQVVPRIQEKSWEHSRNRRVSSPLSPISYLFLAPSGMLYQKVQRLLAEDETPEGNHPPVMIKQRRPGLKHPAYGLPASEWPTVLQRVVEQKEPLRRVAAAYGVSPETIRRLLLHVQKPCGQPEASRDRSCACDRGTMTS
jgi:hypothetical protein